MKIYCDMDGVLVHQTGPSGFDRMPWMPDGRALWDYIKGRATLLSLCNSASGALEKRRWVVEQLGPDVELITRTDVEGKARDCANPQAVLIDDNIKRNRGPWEAAGGVFIFHRSAAESIAALKALGL